MGARLVAVSGVGLVVYGIMFLIRDFTTFIEFGLTPAHVGATPEQIRAFSPHLYNYISHLQIAIAAFLVAIGVSVIALAWWGIRRGERWAAWSVLAVAAVASAIAVPPHYAYGLATMFHIGPIYVDVAILAIGTIVSLRSPPAVGGTNTR
jgi:hypothetical protein